MDFESALGIVRLLINNGIEQEVAISNPAIPPEYQQRIRERLEQEENIILEPPRMLVASADRGEWLHQLDRSTWYYWPTLRQFLLGTRNWSTPSVRSLDEATDRILGQLSPPSAEQFDIRGLVVGYVQSGKTANYTALIAKAADVGYRLVIVLSGIDNGLRRQTQIRLNKELVGYPNNPADAVPLPPVGSRWLQFTNEEIGGDFRPGFANHAALQGTQPVLLVIKKNGSVLRRLHEFIDDAPEDVRRTLPVLVIDDEADQASVDTRGTYQSEDEALSDEDYEAPSVINGRIRDLLRKFQRKAYVAYTATPFANVLIPHDTFDPQVENDLYPKDFIVDLPKPTGYFGAEELFGRFDVDMAESIGGLDVIRNFQERELDDLENHRILPPSLETAMLDFVLAGAARAQRSNDDFPATMLLHGSHLVVKQMEMEQLVNQKFSELRDEWRYQRNHGILRRLRERWERGFRPVIRENHPERDVPFSQIQSHIGPFFESIQVRVINSRTGDILNYEQEPNIKAIAIGGNRLSRGLTLGGLLTSYFFRSTIMYDTLMQMGRWFGFREGYEDLTRIYMTPELSSWFSDLAMVEYELRQDISMYEARNVTPMELGTRIVRHPAMLVTSRLKQRYARTIVLEQSYSGRVQQTIRFPFEQIDDLSSLLDENLQATRTFLSGLGDPVWDDQGPVWQNIGRDLVIDYLQRYRSYREAKNIYMPFIVDYIQRQNEFGELINWTVAIRGRETAEPTLHEIDLGIGQLIPMISRTRLSGDSNSLGVITNPGDEAIALTQEQVNRVGELQQTLNVAANVAARGVRPPTEGLLLIYPVSRFSGHERPPRQSRRPMYDDPHDPRCSDAICLALSFPQTEHDEGIRGEYVIGSVDWSPL